MAETSEKSENSAKVLSSLKHNDVLSSFLKQDFDATGFASQVISAENDDGGPTQSVEQLLTLLNAQVAAVDLAIREHVTQHQPELLDRVGHISELRESMSQIQGGVGRLQVSVNRIKRELLIPHEQMTQCVRRLERMQAAGDVLRRILRLLFVLRKLRGQLKAQERGRLNSRDLAKAAQSLWEVERSMGLHDETAEDSGGSPQDSGGGGGGVMPLTGIAVVAREVEWVRQAGVAVRAQGAACLADGIAKLNQAAVGSALQVFFNLHCLPERLDDALGAIILSLSTAAADALNTQLLQKALAAAAAAHSANGTGAAASSSTPGKGSGSSRHIPSGGVAVGSGGNPPAGAASAWRHALWVRLEAWADSLHLASLQVWNLQRVLFKKRDPATHQRFISQVTAVGQAEGSGAHGVVYAMYWARVTAEVRRQLALAADASPFVKNTLVNQHPRLRSLLISVLARLARSTAGKATAGVGGSDGERQALLSAIQPFMQVFLARSLQRLNQPVNAMGSSAAAATAATAGGDNKSLGQLPTTADVSTLVSAITRELSGARRETSLLLAVSQGVVKAVQLFASKLEGMVNHSPAAFSFGFPNPSAPLGSQAATGKPQTEAQAHNATVCHLLDQLRVALLSLPQTIYSDHAPPPTSGADGAGSGSGSGSGAPSSVTVLARALAPCVQLLVRLGGEVEGALVAAAAQELERILACMHRENFGSSAHSRLGGGLVGKLRGQGSNATPAAAAAASSGGGGGGGDGASHYMRQLSSAIAWLGGQQLAALPPSSLTTHMHRLLAARVLRMFVTHAAIIRPLAEEGRLKLAQDMAQLELAVAPLMLAPNESTSSANASATSATAAAAKPPSGSGARGLASLGEPYRHLRALRPLLFVETAQLMEQPEIHELRPSTVCHLVLARGPAELQLPHTRAGWSSSRYLGWIDSRHAAYGGATASIVESDNGAKCVQGPVSLTVGADSRATSAAAAEEDIWRRIVACLDSYAQRVSTRGDPQLSAVYVAVLEAGPKLLATFKESATRK